jgi:vacuolar iron transporter family protein
VLSREELGLNPDDLGSPWGAASFSFASFAVGAAVPLAPFASGLQSTAGIAATAAATLVTLALVGMVLSLFTGRAAWRGALRMVLIGGGAGVVSFLVGRALGGMLH